MIWSSLFQWLSGRCSWKIINYQVHKISLCVIAGSWLCTFNPPFTDVSRTVESATSFQATATRQRAEHHGLQGETSSVQSQWRPIERPLACTCGTSMLSLGKGMCLRKCFQPHSAELLRVVVPLDSAGGHGEMEGGFFSLMISPYPQNPPNCRLYSNLVFPVYWFWGVFPLQKHSPTGLMKLFLFQRD